MVEAATILLLLGPPAAVVVAAYSYYALRRRKGKKDRRKLLLFNLPLSFLSANWLAFVIDNAGRLGIHPSDVDFLSQVKETLTHLPVVDIMPVEVRLILVLTVVIYLIMIPSP